MDTVARKEMVKVAKDFCRSIEWFDAIAKIEPYFNGRICVSVKPPYKETITISEDRVAPFKVWLNY